MQILSNDPVTRRKLGLGLLVLAATTCMPQKAAPPSEPDDSPREGRALQKPKKPTTARKLKILCLHGYHGSARSLRSQMGSLVSELEPLAELVFIDAPSLAAGDYGWWHAVNDERAVASDDPGVDGPRRHY